MTSCTSWSTLRTTLISRLPSRGCLRKSFDLPRRRDSQNMVRKWYTVTLERGRNRRLRTKGWPGQWTRPAAGRPRRGSVLRRARGTRDECRGDEAPPGLPGWEGKCRRPRRPNARPSFGSRGRLLPSRRSIAARLAQRYSKSGLRKPIKATCTSADLALTEPCHVHEQRCPLTSSRPGWPKSEKTRWLTGCPDHLAQAGAVDEGTITAPYSPRCSQASSGSPAR